MRQAQPGGVLVGQQYRQSRCRTVLIKTPIGAGIGGNPAAFLRALQGIEAGKGVAFQIRNHTKGEQGCSAQNDNGAEQRRQVVPVWQGDLGI
ncbi:hypothetical protein NA644_01230 [Pseudomonas stutzeri]|uniref:hypothetical protein n=1 Tax=Stutzerimonas stutzeri TaxID=316 RepID=UPI0011AF14BC|nr:hypothetical protein [Stutzerimonas stutzeri]MCQ4247920.1 hypothetical protein [Stutzerimonas stutzeri]